MTGEREGEAMAKVVVGSVLEGDYVAGGGGVLKVTQQENCLGARKIKK